MMESKSSWIVLIGSLSLACQAPKQDSSDDDGGDDGITATDSAETTSGSITPETDGDEEGETCSFLGCQDVPPDDDVIECDIWAQDCMDGEKCVAWANDGGSSWNATKCVPLSDDPKQPGDTCTAPNGGVFGEDDCDVSSMCWEVDAETNMGTCVAFCNGSEANPSCEDPDATCVIANEGVLILCLPTCDPLLQDCPDGQACYPWDPDFVCVPDASGITLGTYGDPCEYANACDPGLFCAPATGVPGCQASGCCSEYCDVDDPNADASCSGAAQGQQCTSWFEDGLAPPGFENIGACLLPEG